MFRSKFIFTEGYIRFGHLSRTFHNSLQHPFGVFIRRRGDRETERERESVEKKRNEKNKRAKSKFQALIYKIVKATEVVSVFWTEKHLHSLNNWVTQFIFFGWSGFWVTSWNFVLFKCHCQWISSETIYNSIYHCARIQNLASRWSVCFVLFLIKAEEINFNSWYEWNCFGNSIIHCISSRVDEFKQKSNR